MDPQQIFTWGKIGKGSLSDTGWKTLRNRGAAPTEILSLEGEVQKPCTSEKKAKCISRVWKLTDLVAALLKGEVIVACKLSMNGMLSPRIRQAVLHWKECGEYIKESYCSFVLSHIFYVNLAVQEGCWKTGKNPKER